MSLLQNAKLCHKCGENYVGRLCPKCSTKAELIAGRRNEIPSGEAVAGNREGKVLAAHASGAAPDNPVGSGAKASADAPPASRKPSRGMSAPALTIRLTGQVRGGKNAMGVTRSGRHYARSPFKKWRDAAVSEIVAQLPQGFYPFWKPANVRLEYVSGDKRRRDMPAVIDAVWHALERAGAVQDDAILWVTESSRSYDKANPGVTITFL